jgi:hypothetical protein
MHARLLLTALAFTAACEPAESGTKSDTSGLAVETRENNPADGSDDGATAVPMDGELQDHQIPRDFSIELDPDLPVVEMPVLDRPLPDRSRCMGPALERDWSGNGPAVPPVRLHSSAPMGIAGPLRPGDLRLGRGLPAVPQELPHLDPAGCVRDPVKEAPPVCALGADDWIDNPSNWSALVLVFGNEEIDQERALELLEAPAGVDGIQELAAQLVTAELNAHIGMDMSAATEAMDAAHLLIAYFQAEHGPVGEAQCSGAACVGLDQLSMNVAGALEDWSLDHCE